MNHEKKIKYICQQKWFFGVRRVVSPKYLSIKLRGEKKLIPRYHRAEFVERLIVPLKKDFPTVIINLDQAKRFHSKSLQRLVKDSRLLEKYIDREDKNWQEMLALGKKLVRASKKKELKEVKKLFAKIVVRLERHGFYFFTIFSMGKVLTEYANKVKVSGDIKKALQKHDKWRNSVVFNEEKIIGCINQYLDLLGKSSGFSKDKIIEYLTIDEVEELLSGKSSSEDVKKIIAARQKHGFAFLALKQGFFVIDDPNQLKKIKKHFVELNNEKIKKPLKDKKIKGTVAFRSDKKIKGRVKLVFPEEKAPKSCTNRVLVTTQTTPKIIECIKGAKAIITDEGGLTCHAAITARELRIPCIVGTKIATKVLKDGDMVEVDADRGIVRLIK